MIADVNLPTPSSWTHQVLSQPTYSGFFIRGSKVSMAKLVRRVCWNTPGNVLASSFVLPYRNSLITSININCLNLHTNVIHTYICFNYFSRSSTTYCLMFFSSARKARERGMFLHSTPPRHNAMILVCDAYALFKLLPKFAPAWDQTLSVMHICLYHVQTNPCSNSWHGHAIRW